jgi:hypothetical protein
MQEADTRGGQPVAEASQGDRGTLGLDASQSEYLCGMAQDCFGPTAFDLEVQFYLDKLSKEKDER